MAMTFAMATLEVTSLIQFSKTVRENNFYLDLYT